MSFNYKKITIKVGSNVLTKTDGTLNVARMAHLVDQIAQLYKQGVEVILVSSGAVAAGRSEIKLNKKLDTVSSRQLYSAVGQVKMINQWADFFTQHGINCAQVLTTKDNFGERNHYLNMKNCFTTLLENGVVPIVNENDTISVSELMFTDNDELSGLIASMQNSDALLILSNIDGIYDGNPALPESKVITEIGQKDRDWMENISTQKSGFGRGGMLTKSSIARKTAKEGIAVHIANGLRDNVLTDILRKESQVIHTWFKPGKRKASNVKKWIAYSDSFAKGELVINQGACEALFSPKATSLLPIGVTKVKGQFKKGDIVKIMDEKGHLIGWGKSQYAAEKVHAKSDSAKQKPVVHYDYLYLSED
ncbi:glutamate 5-kinase [Sunxiuqinia elliptica]|uniref:Glutamate 5-kinase n=1 Tax=Sunxiuqinia elliptica TaxID=655355 RepID=A0A4R6HBV3_9BACT|nr:glutamate 5-kinase [Sunxiuqinia elliptica]TDO05644.1 glutamate 5-kinase [Sunxiuqinia elliptica]TDO65188.1 glutamate 5-kinase [Sunxiuqinia elliptica]